MQTIKIYDAVINSYKTDDEVDEYINNIEQTIMANTSDNAFFIRVQNIVRDELYFVPCASLKNESTLDTSKMLSESTYTDNFINLFTESLKETNEI